MAVRIPVPGRLDPAEHRDQAAWANGWSVRSSATMKYSLVTSAERIVQDVRYAIRTLRRAPGFTGVACATLALGIGATTAIFTIVDSVLLRSLPFPEPQRLMMIWERPSRTDRRNVVSMSNYLAWQDRNRAFDAIAAFHRVPMNVMGGDEPIQVSGAGVTADFFRVLGVAPLLGRTFVRGEDAVGAAPVVVLTYGFWQRQYGGDPSAVGRFLTLDGRRIPIVGVAPAHFFGKGDGATVTPVTSVTWTAAVQKYG